MISKIRNNKVTVFYAILSLLIPFFVLSAFRLLYSSGYGLMLPNVLHISSIVISSLASLSFFLFTRHSNYLYSCSPIWPVLFSIAYGLCSYAVIQETDIKRFLIFAILPILFDSFTWFLHHGKALYFTFVIAICLSLDSVTSVILFFFLCMCFFAMWERHSYSMFADFLQLILSFVFAFALTGLISIPSIYNFLSDASANSYPGFQFSYYFSNFLSRFLLGASTYEMFPGCKGLHLYCGLFCIILLIFYFVNQSIPFKERKRNLILTLLFTAIMEFSPLQFLMELCTNSASSTVFYDFFLVFWMLRLGMESFSSIKAISKKRMLPGVFFSLLFLFGALCGSTHNFDSVTIKSIILFFLLLLFSIAGLCIKSLERVGTLLLVCLIPLELLCSIFFSTNQNCIPFSSSSSDLFFWNEQEQTPEEIASSIPQLEEYQTYYETHYASEEIIPTLNALHSCVELSLSERTDYKEYGLLNYFEEANAMCEKIGTKSELFHPSDVSFHFDSSDLYRITPQGANIYNLFATKASESYDQLIVSYSYSVPEDGLLVFYNDYTHDVFLVDTASDTEHKGYLKALREDSTTINFQIDAYFIDMDTLSTISALLGNYYMENHASFQKSVYISGLCATFISVFFLLLFLINKDRASWLQWFARKKEQISSIRIFGVIRKHLKANYVYYLAFLIPAGLYFLSMIICSCAPFGANSFLDQDGYPSILAGYLDVYYNLKQGNFIFSMLGGYGQPMYYTYPTYLFRMLPLTIFPASSIAYIILLIEGLCLGFAGFSVVYYLTHRLNGRRADKKDYRILFSVLIYTLNMYMLSMHSYTEWYYVLMVLPLLIYSLDRLMEQKKWVCYSLLLIFCMYNSIQLALYCCIFLVLQFFTYHFSSIKDFIKKGFLFAFASILSAISSFVIIYNTMFAMTDSPYKANDTTFPSFGFHTSFLEQWKNFMPLSEATAVTTDEGYASLYLGIFTLLLVVIYMLAKNVTLKEKCKRLIPVAILVISFNEQILSYLWNGFHYQSNVPNRFAFIFMFLCAVISYDAITQIRHVSIWKFLIASLSVVAVFCLCQFTGDGNTTQAFVFTIVLILVYLIAHLLYAKGLLNRTFYPKLLLVLLGLELGINMIFTSLHYDLHSISLLGDYQAEHEYDQFLTEKEDDFFRVLTPSDFTVNSGLLNGVASVNSFTPYLSVHQQILNYLYGLLGGTNFIIAGHASTPLGLAMSDSKYLFVPCFTYNTLPDLSQYEYLGSMNNNYIYKVPDTLPLGYYAPEDIFELTFPTLWDIPAFLNGFVSDYTDAGTDSIFELGTLQFDPKLSGENTFRYIDEDGMVLSMEDAMDMVEENSSKSAAPSVRSLFIEANIKASTSGEGYLYSYEMVPIGSVEGNQSFTVKEIYPNFGFNDTGTMTYCIFHREVFDEFMENASQNQMENITVNDNHITGTTNYQNDGYTIFSLAYSNCWKAYVDGVEVPIYDPQYSFMIIPTPAGDHQIELVYTPANWMLVYGISAGGFLIIGLLAIFSKYLCSKSKTHRKELENEKN